MNPDRDLQQLKKKLYSLEPSDPHHLMLRAVFDHELDARFMAWRDACKALGVRAVLITDRGDYVRFTPYLTDSVLKPLMYQYWGSKNSAFLIRLPPKFWGLHIL